ncbi:histidine kinase [Stylonychia lemnae]|uniref:Histidine kinase n=1 Tax=Stylonychia lemnae TaxID=5949 RepID=A0A078A0H6_STYLE|nr:histidine kinase [Stylonychia lemnae]|eukprot:CDW75347.1 histidine kinase [Stylonychia lemnae]
MALHKASRTSVKKLIKKIEHLYEVIARKELFQAAMIHELRQPLNSVIGGVELLSNSKCLSIDDKKNVQIAQYSANILMNLIGNILDIAKFEANKVELDLQYTLIKQTFKSIIELVEFKSNEKKLQLQYYFAPEVPDYVYLDNPRFTQIILNLISNAVKFTQKGFVRVIVNFIPELNNEDQNNKNLVKRNSAPENFHEFKNELLNITSHESENSSDLKYLSGAQNKKFSIKRSLMQIPNQYFQDFQSSNERSNSLNFISSQRQREQQLSNEKQLLDSFDQNQLGRGINNEEEQRIIRSVQQNMQRSQSNSKHMLQKSQSNHQAMRNCRCTDINGDPDGYDLCHAQFETFNRAKSQNLFSRRGESLLKQITLGLQKGGQENRIQLDNSVTPQIDNANEIDRERLLPSQQNDILARQNTNEQFLDDDIDENVDIRCCGLEAWGSNNPVSFFRYHKAPPLRNILIQNIQLSNQQTPSSSLNPNRQRIVDENFEEIKQIPLDQNDRENEFRINLEYEIEANCNFRLANRSRDLAQNKRQTSSIMRIEQNNDEIIKQHVSPSNQQDTIKILNNNINSQQQVQGGQQQNNFINQNQEREREEEIKIQEEFTLSGKIANMKQANTNRARPHSDINIERQPNRDIRSQVQNKSDNFHQIKIQSDPFNLCPDIVNNQSSQTMRRVPSDAPSIISDPKIISKSIKYGYLQITIQDTGIGIDDDEQKKLFNPFQQANNSIRKKFGGTGLGLWITKKLLNFMRGKINLKSIPGVGTTFQICIPVQGVSYDHNIELSPVNNNQTQLETNLLKISALILIQDEFNKEILRKFLFKLQCPHIFSSDYDEFIRKLQYVQKFNVCIVDADQFYLTQLETIKQIKQCKKEIEFRTQKTLTMLVLTNLDINQRQRNKFLQDRVIIMKKPVKQNTLKNILQEIQNRERSLLPHLIMKQQNKVKDMRLRHRKNTEYMSQKKFDSLKARDLLTPEFLFREKHNSQVLEQVSNKNFLDREISICTPNFNKKAGGTRYIESGGHDSGLLMIESREFRSHFIPENSDANLGNSQSMTPGKFTDGETTFQNNHNESLKNNEGMNYLKPLAYQFRQQNQFLFKTIKEESSSQGYIKNDTFNQRTIIIADDGDTNRIIFSQILNHIPLVSENNITIITVENGQEALDRYKIQSSSIQLILMDLHMPVMEGVESASLIREFENQNNIEPRVYILGVTGENIDMKFKRNYSYEQCGINEFLTKPLHICQLEPIINKIYGSSDI